MHNQYTTSERAQERPARPTAAVYVTLMCLNKCWNRTVAYSTVRLGMMLLRFKPLLRADS